MKISTGENFLIYSMPKRTQNLQNSTQVLLTMYGDYQAVRWGALYVDY